MTLEDRLRSVVAALPDEISVTLPVVLLRDWLEMDDADGTDHVGDLTVDQVAEEFDRSPQTVRNWIRAGELDAYKFRGREYRVTRAASELLHSLSCCLM